MRSWVELFELIRRDGRDGLSIRESAERHHVHRRTVRLALAAAVRVGCRASFLWAGVVLGFHAAEPHLPALLSQRRGFSSPAALSMSVEKMFGQRNEVVHPLRTGLIGPAAADPGDGGIEPGLNGTQDDVPPQAEGELVCGSHLRVVAAGGSQGLFVAEENAALEVDQVG